MFSVYRIQTKVLIRSNTSYYSNLPCRNAGLLHLSKTRKVCPHSQYGFDFISLISVCSNLSVLVSDTAAVE